MRRMLLMLLIGLAPSISGGCGEKYAMAPAVWAQEPTPAPPVPAPPPADTPAPPSEPPPAVPEPEAAPMDWQPLVAGLINSVLVLAVVQILKRQLPDLRLAVPWALPMVTPILGPLFAVGQSALAGWLDWPIDLSPILGVFTGAAAVAAHQIHRQSRGPTPVAR